MARPSADEIDLWRRAMRDAVPLRGRPARSDLVPERRHPAGPLPGPNDGKPEKAAGKMPAVPHARLPTPAQPLDRFAGVDRATAERVRRGRYPVAGRLDLHGLTQAEAHRALFGFVGGARAAGKRCVLIITGHGRISGGVLKAAVPRWLGEPELRRHVLAIAPAQPQHGGDGALYLLLRKTA
jgi:DNA-nicking Smr family endonuclease